MKKIFILALISILGSALFGIEARVVSVTGKVQVQRGAAWIDLKPNDIIRKGEVIQTGFKSEAQLSITSSNQNSKLTVAPLSRLTIEQLVEGAGADKTSVYVTTGSVKSEIKKTEDRRASYTVRGPVATASVRGTVIVTSWGYDSAALDTAEGNAAFYPTAASAKGPSVSSAEDDRAFASLSKEDMAKENIYPQPTVNTSSVKAGQSAAVSGGNTVSVQDKAVASVSTLSPVTNTMAVSETINTATGDAESGRSWQIPTGVVSVKINFAE